MVVETTIGGGFGHPQMAKDFSFFFFPFSF
jgi:hypothetical protein